MACGASERKNNRILAFYELACLDSYEHASVLLQALGAFYIIVIEGYLRDAWRGGGRPYQPRIGDDEVPLSLLLVIGLGTEELLLIRLEQHNNL